MMAHESFCFSTTAVQQLAAPKRYKRLKEALGDRQQLLAYPCRHPSQVLLKTIYRLD